MKIINTLKNNLLSGIVRGIITGVIFGTVLGLELAGLGDLLPYPKDALLFITGFVALCILSFAFVFLFIGIILAFFNRKSTTAVTFVSVFVLISFQPLLVWIESNRPVNLFQLKFLLGCFIIFILALICALYLTRFIQNRRDFFPHRIRCWFYATGVYFVAVGITLVLISLLFFHTPVRKVPLGAIQPAGKILLIGVDAADMNTLLPLIRAKKLPNFEKLINEGASGVLPSLVSMYNPFSNTITNGIKSAAVWNSILTGKTPAKHGIKDFIYTEIRWLSHPYRYPLLPSFLPYRKRISNLLGLRYRPFNSNLRKTKAVWNIFSDAGLKSVSLGWWMTWPAEHIHGEILTDRFDDPDLPARWFPEQFLQQTRIDTLLARYQKPLKSDVEYFSLFVYEPEYAEQFEPASRNYFRNFMYYNLLKSYYQDQFRQQLGLVLYQEHDYDFFGLYLYGLDTAGHAFSRFKYPYLFPDVQAEEIEYFGQVIDRYYEWIDSVIGRYLEQVDDQTTVIICSDHGMGPLSGISVKRTDLPLSGSHRKDGLIILWGAKIRRGIQIQPENLLDVFPTALYLTGLPVARDMDGNVLKEAIDENYCHLHPVQTIDTYETQRYSYNKKVPDPAIKNYNKSTMQRLKTLGYIK